jgi:hypothetical protein
VTGDSHPGDRDPHEGDEPDTGGIDWLQSQLGADSDEEGDEPAAGAPAADGGPASAADGGPASADPVAAGPASAHREAGPPGATASQPAPDAPSTRRIRDEIEAEPAPWWTTPVQKPLIPTEEETRLMPAAVAPVVEPAADAPADASADASAGGTGGSGTGRTPSPSRAMRVLIWVAAGLLALVLLIGLFFLGQQLGGASAPAPAPSSTATPTPTSTPTPTPEAVGPQGHGIHKWDALGGGECLQPYTSPWEEEFTVVDCAAPHAAQLVYRGVFAGDVTTAFPGQAALAAQINLLCSAPGVIDLNAAGGYPDLQLQGSYPVTAEQWTSGPRHYYCFVSRSSGEPLSASIAGPGPAPAG